jgi:hypothetical protein
MRSPTYLLLILVLLSSGCSTTSKKHTQDQLQKTQNSSQINRIYFAGFALSGDNQSSSVNFPYTFELMNEKTDKGISVLDQEAQTLIKTVHNPNLEIITDGLGDYKKDQGISAAVVIDSEDISQEVIGGNTKVVVTLRGQIVAFNFKEMKVVGSYPVTAELIDVANKKLNEKELSQAIKKLYIGTGRSFIKELVDRFNKISINTSYTHGIQVKNVIIPNDIAKLIEKPNQTQRDLQTFVARNFEKYLSINQNVAILPFTKDQSVGSRLSARFSNGEIFNLTIPSADYVVGLEMKKIKKARVGGNNVEDIYGYVSIINIKAEQPEMNKNYLDIDVRQALPITIPKSMTSSDDRSHYIESTIQSLNEFSKQINKPESKWLDTWVESKKDSSEQFEEFYEVIKKCK